MADQLVQWDQGYTNHNIGVLKTCQKSVTASQGLTITPTQKFHR